MPLIYVSFPELYEGDLRSMTNDRDLHTDDYEAPALVDLGTIEEWTKANCNEFVCISIVLP